MTLDIKDDVINILNFHNGWSMNDSALLIMVS
jgi:hypothetical protein